MTSPEGISQRNHDLDNREKVIFSKGSYLGGLFEVGGWMSLRKATINRQGKNGPINRTRVFPIIEYGDNDPVRVLTLKNYFGGSFFKRGGNSWRWEVTDRRAYQIGEAIDPYAPSRREILLAYQNLGNVESLEEKLEIFEEAREIQRSSVTKSEYRSLVLDPAFTAGIVDARGGSSTNEKYIAEELSGFTYSGINVYSTNRPLLEALFEVFGGNFGVMRLSGIETMILGKRTKLNRESLRWQVMSKDEVANIIAYILPHILLRREEMLKLLG